MPPYLPIPTFPLTYLLTYTPSFLSVPIFLPFYPTYQPIRFVFLFSCQQINMTTRVRFFFFFFCVYVYVCYYVCVFLHCHASIMTCILAPVSHFYITALACLLQQPPSYVTPRRPSLGPPHYLFLGHRTASLTANHCIKPREPNSKHARCISWDN